MKKTFIIIYSIIVSIVLIFAISLFGVNIYKENSHGELRTQVRFEKVVSGVKSAFEKNNISSSEKIRLIENSIGDTKDFSFITINVDGKPFYIFPDDYNQTQENTSKLVLTYNKSFNVNSFNINISSGMYSVRPVSIFDNAKISFFIILIVTLLTIILIIYNNQFGKENSKKIVSKKQNQRLSFSNNDEDVEDVEQEDFEKFDEEQNKENINKEIINSSEEKNDDNKPSVKEETLKEPEPEQAEIKNEKELEELPVKDFEPVEILEESTHSEKGLFSPDTGLGWESYLITRLDNELNRATATELDLALFIIKLDGLGRKNPIMKKICEYLTVEFQFKDLLFEYKDDSICGIKISMTIDSAITFAEKLIEDLKNITVEETPTILIGVTTRGIRMVSGERLLKEADEALKHAAEDPKSPVVGFRADATRYRKFLEKQ